MRVAVIGPESTGKTTLCHKLANHYEGTYIDEYARTYTERLQHEYTQHDVETIALKQIEQLSETYDSAYVFFDTDLVITKVWFDVKYGSCPQWVTEAMITFKPDVYLICLPDIEFVEDPVRENGDKRDLLLQLYIIEVQKLGIPYYYISGKGEKRTETAVKALDEFITNRIK